MVLEQPVRVNADKDAAMMVVVNSFFIKRPRCKYIKKLNNIEIKNGNLLKLETESKLLENAEFIKAKFPGSVYIGWKE